MADRRDERTHPDVIFLAEAFTRPKVMHRLAKLGFTQSYTYFTWRNTKRELAEYFTELSRGQGREYFRPTYGRTRPTSFTRRCNRACAPPSRRRLVLAATLSANYGIYGPTFELMESTPREPGSEEYRDSEKYQLRALDPGPPRQPTLPDRPHQPHSPRQRGAAVRRDR